MLNERSKKVQTNIKKNMTPALHTSVRKQAIGLSVKVSGAIYDGFPADSSLI